MIKGDITITWQPTLIRGDWTLDTDGDLLSGNDLHTAVFVSLFSDRLADSSDVLPDIPTPGVPPDRRGWWADTETDKIGSRLWLLERAKQTQDNLRKAKDYILESLQWMIDDKVASGVTAAVWYPAMNMLAARIIISRQNSAQATLQFSWAWAGIG